MQTMIKKRGHVTKNEPDYTKTTKKRKEDETNISTTMVSHAQCLKNLFRKCERNGKNSGTTNAGKTNEPDYKLRKENEANVRSNNDLSS